MNETPHNSDEISLRDLYLILKRGMPLIVVIALAVGLAAFVLTSLMAPTYEAESTTLINPSPVRVEGPGNLRFNPSNEVSFEAYETLATSRPVLESALERVPRADLSPRQLLGMGSIDKLLGADRPEQMAPLSVTHTVRSTDPELAATLADAWAEASLETVRESLLAGLGPVNAATLREIARLQEELEAAEATWRTFQEEDRGAILEARSDNLTERIAAGEARLDELDRDITSLQARLDTVRQRLDQAAGQEAPRLDEDASRALIEALNVSRAAGAIDGGVASRIEFLLQRGAADEQLFGILDRNELGSLEVSLAGRQAERDRLAGQLEDYQRQIGLLLEEIAELDERRTQLERTVSTARAAYDDVIALQPIITYVTELAPVNARFLSQASVPTEPTGPRRTLNTVLATVIAGMLALLFVFLREAVAAPAPSTESTRATQHPPPRQTARD